MLSGDFAQTFESARILTFASADGCDRDILGEAEVSFSSRLIRNRRSLPVHHDGFWRCYECHFESRSLGIMALHVLRARKPAPLSDDEIVEGVTLEAR